MIKKNKLTLVSRYVHTGNSGATLSLVRNDKRTDGAHLQLSIGAFGKISSDITVIGTEYSGFSSDQLRDFAHMFLYAANELEKNGKDQSFASGRTCPILNDNKKDCVIAKQALDNNSEDSKSASALSELGSKSVMSKKARKKTISCTDLPDDIVTTMFPKSFGRTIEMEKFVDENPDLTLKDYLQLSLKKAIEQ